jgi:WD40 repeat protein
MRLASRMMAPVAAAAGLLCAVTTAAGAVTTTARAVHAAPAHAAGPSPVHAGTISGTGVVPGGTRLWVQRFTGSTGSADRAGTGTSVAVSPDRSIVYVTGITERDVTRRAQREATTVAYNALNGSTLWVASYQGAPFTASGQPAAVVSPDGSKVFVVSQLGQADLVVLAYNAQTGASLWTALINGHEGGFQAADPVAVSPDSSQVFVAATSPGRFSPSNVAYAFDADTGVQEWSALTTLRHPLTHSVTSITVSPDGTTAYESGTAGVVAYAAATGSVLWTVHYKRRWQDQGDYLAVSPDSSTVYVTNTSDLGDTGYFTHIVTTAYDATTGAQLWATRYHGPATASVHGLAMSPDGSQLFITGAVQNATSCCVSHTEIIGYDAVTGAQLWATRSAGGAAPAAIVVSPDGSQVFITGSASADGGVQANYATESYDAATGAQLWAAVTPGQPAGYAIPAGIVVSPDGSRVFVTGGVTSTTGSGASYYMTVAYHT